jgi:CDGSH iron-sulfur domain-containing protein 3
VDDPEISDPPRSQAVTIKVRRNGPYKITGPVVVVDHEGRPIPTTDAEESDGTIVLCRCGASSTKPFCDSSHRALGLDDG